MTVLISLNTGGKINARAKCLNCEGIVLAENENTVTFEKIDKNDGGLRILGAIATCRTCQSV